MAAVIAGIGFWFFTVPQPRLAMGMFWVFAGLCLAQLFGDPRSMRAGMRQAGLAFLLVLGLSPLWIPAFGLVLSGRGTGLTALTENLFVQPAGDRWWHPMPPTPPLDSYRTDSGLEIWVPERGDVRCWDAPLPCTPYPAPNIRLRDPTNLGSGFETVGPWSQTRWPNPRGTFMETWLEYRDR
jgi:hypothetical protein